MSGGIAQLVAVGSPEISFFHSTYKPSTQGF